MKTSKTLRLAAVFCFALANMWIAVQPADAQSGGSGSSGKATVKKTYNSGQSTTGYTKANPVSSGTGSSVGAYPAGNFGTPGLQQGGGKSGK